MVCRKFFVKVVGDSGLLEKTIRDYDSEWDLDAFVTHENPIMVSVSGSMVQQEIRQPFLGPVLEEKFYAKCSSITVLPCLPLVPEVLKDKVHPDISPNMVQEGVTNGYFLVNHSLNQTFGEPDFREIDTKKGNEEDHISEDGHNALHSDQDEIESNSSENEDYENG
ncbi:hypothetical protein A0J61_11728, partial [Choanephora cucurbitarum]